MTADNTATVENAAPANENGNGNGESFVPKKRISAKEFGSPIDWPDKPTPTTVGASQSLILAFVRAMLTCVVHGKTFKGKKGPAINAKAGAKYTKSLFGKAWTTTQVVDFLRPLVGKIPIYHKTNLCWTVDANGQPTADSFYWEFRDAWNAAEGNPKDCSEIIGTNDWGEEIMSENFCYQKWKQWHESDPNLAAIVDGYEATKGKGRKKAELNIDEETAIALKDLIANAMNPPAENNENAE